MNKWRIYNYIGIINFQIEKLIRVKRSTGIISPPGQLYIRIYTPVYLVIFLFLVRLLSGERFSMLLLKNQATCSRVNPSYLDEFTKSMLIY